MAVDLSSIVKGQRLKPPKIVVYGRGGIGKTTFAAGAPNPIFLCTEEGLGSLDIAAFELREKDPILRSWDELIECLGVLYTEEHDYETVVLDTLDSAEPLLWDHTCKLHGQPRIDAQTREFGYQRGYRAAVDAAMPLLDGLDALRRKKNMAVVVLCHSTVVRADDPNAASYDKYDLALHKWLADRVYYWADCVLFAQDDSSVVQEEGKHGRTRHRAVGRGERKLMCDSRPAFAAKNRYGLPPELPLPRELGAGWKIFQDHVTAGFSPAGSKEEEAKP